MQHTIKFYDDIMKINERRGAELDFKQYVSEHTLKCLAGGFVIGALVMGVGSVMVSATGGPAFCGSCHAMKEPAASHAMATHKDRDCVECHLPHDNPAIYLIEKGRTGMIDTYHEVLRDYPAHIQLSKGAKETVNKNCLRCHQTTVERVKMGAAPMDTGDCMKCHSRVAHGSNHLEGGIKVE